MLNDPLKKVFHIHWGDLGTTTLFFLISGFLIAQSIDRSKNSLAFISNRFFKIFPIVIIANLIFVFFSFFASDVDFKTYFFSAELRHFLFKNCVLIYDIKQRIGLGVFKNNPLPLVLNAQWWTLKWTIISYLFAFILFYPLKFISQKLYYNLFLVSLLIYLNYINPDESSWMGTIFTFFLTGIFYYHNKEKIPINYFIAIIAFIIYVITYDLNLILFLSPFLKGYLLFFIATKSNKILLRFNSLRDLSFGIFIYHVFFIQFLIFVGMKNLYSLFFITLILTTIFAYFSSLSSEWIKFKTYKILKSLT
jgi:peptidoglycan/LPS O-acetylase OafA/YrhL